MPILLILFLIVAVVIFMPLAVIWALNTLFGLAIAYTFKTWLAAFVLGMVFGGKSASSRKS